MPAPKKLSSLKVDELDALAEELGIAEYPADGNKDAKVAALEAAGAGAAQVYVVRLVDELNGEPVHSAQFMAGTEHVELTRDAPEYRTTDHRLLLGIRELPFLEVVEG